MLTSFEASFELSCDICSPSESEPVTYETLQTQEYKCHLR